MYCELWGSAGARPLRVVRCASGLRFGQLRALRVVQWSVVTLRVVQWSMVSGRVALRAMIMRDD